MAISYLELVVKRIQRLGVFRFRTNSSQLLLPGEPEAYLEQVGWNDRISSIKNFGNIY